jgi:adenine-specific DNA-methyltransferase
MTLSGGAALARSDLDAASMNGARPFVQRAYPQFIKYMGSKSKIMNFVLTGINDVHRGGAVCDLFAGSASLSGAIGNQAAVHSNDIQRYSGVLARAYLTAWRAPTSPSASQLVAEAQALVDEHLPSAGDIHDYAKEVSLKAFQRAEVNERYKIDLQLDRPWHLFFKNYSGTWWSAKQALWIDALRQVAERYKADPVYDAVLASIMFAMAYASQGTGHYAQYRVANTESSMRDISLYRRRSVAELFDRKYAAVLDSLPIQAPNTPHLTTALDYEACLKGFSGGTVYADPPYAFVHYSRFYHALETLVLYDYPTLQTIRGAVVKGRYRDDRHQSPFCIASQVQEAFAALFSAVAASGSNLALSYSQSGMITLATLVEIAAEQFGADAVEVLSTDYRHMTLGRQFDRDRQVKECLVLVKAG